MLEHQRPAQNRVGMWWALDLSGGPGSVECQANINFQVSLVYFPSLQIPIPPLKVTGDFKDIIVNALLVLYKLMLNVNYILPQVARGRCFFQCLHTI